MGRRPLRALIVEDNEDDAELLLRELKRGGFDVTFRRVETEGTMAAALASEPWDVVLSDFSLPTFDAHGALSVTKKSGLDLPLIVISGTIGEETAADALRAGARDFIVKGRLARLVPAIDRELQEAKMRATLRRTEEHLRRAQKLEAIGQLAGGVAHDFNNVLSVILINAELLADGLKTGEADAGDLDEIRSAAMRAAELTKQLLAFGRKQVLEPRVVDLNEVVAGIDKMLRRLIGADIEIAKIAAPDLGRVEVDPGKVEQVIVNLALNARDAMPSGGRLTIETSNVTLDEDFAAAHLDVRPGDYVLLTVSDDGEGMDRATLDRIFEPFFTTKEQGRGTGLGLATVFGIVKQSGGHLFVYSEPGVGTSFKIYLPRTQRAETGPTPRPPDVATLRGTETILLVEDDEQVRSVALVVLQRNGYEVVVADDGEDAVRICRTHTSPIHLLLTDVVMPRMDGKAVAARVRELCPEIKVLLMSGYTNASVVKRGVMTPHDSFLEKPITPYALLRRVRAVLDGG